MIAISIDECKIYVLDTFRDVGRAPLKRFGIDTMVSMDATAICKKQLNCMMRKPLKLLYMAECSSSD